MKRNSLSVGQDSCDIKGFTNVHIQGAVDRLGLLGGGTVELSEGTFRMADSLHLRSNVTVRGQGEKTVLRKNAMKKAAVIAHLGFGHYDLIVDTPDVFELGDGVMAYDDHAFAFYTTVSTLVAREGDTWITNRPHNHDYTHRSHGGVVTLFPVVSASDITDAVLEGLSIDGNKNENPLRLTGCRGGGFFAIRSNRIAVRHVTVRDYHGDGFSFQTCDDVEIAHSTAEQCVENGFHPGSGSNRFHIHHGTSRNNGGCGLFYCLRVRDSILEDCVLEDNGGHGVSIGSRDTGHRNRRLTIRNNGGSGIFFRPDDAINSPHGNHIEECVIEENVAKGGADDAEILLQGQPKDVRIHGNRIRRRPDRPAMLIRPEMPAFYEHDNRIEPPGADAIVDLRPRT